MPDTVDDSQTEIPRQSSVGVTMVSSQVVGAAPPSIPDARYEIGPEIARGGMGRVVEATDTFLGRVVALKEALADDKDSIERFNRETRITARLEHPAIVPVHDGGVGSNGMPYYVMRKISGTQLERLVAKGESLGERLALIPHIVATAQAVAHAHERGIVHRDIKPSNILVGELGETILIDWGLAKLIGETEEPTSGRVSTSANVRTNDLDTIKTRAGIVFGTPGFMAPEQLRGGPVDPRWDVYALGATLYHLLSRKPPHFSKSADEMMMSAVKAPPVPIGDVVAGVPPELSAIVDKALAFNPGQRYPDAKELAEDLSRFTTGKLVAAHHYTRKERITRFVRQHRVEVVTSIVAFLLLAIFGTAAVVRIVRERNRADHAAVIARKAQHEAEDNAEELRLGQARALASANPTLAIALLKPLAEKRWQEVRVIAAQARGSGVAWGLPASRTTHALAMAPDGLHAISVGDDGRVRLYDLAAHTTRDLLDAKYPVNVRYFADGKQIALWAQKRISIVDVATGARRDITQPMAVSNFDLAGTEAYWTDPDGALWHLDLAGSDTTAKQIPTEEKISIVSCSPAGKWVVLAGETRMWIYNRQTPDEPPAFWMISHVRAFDWDVTGTYVGVLDDQQAATVRVEPFVTTIHREFTVRNSVAQVGQWLYATGATNVAVFRAASGKVRKAIGRGIGMAQARKGSVIAGAEDAILVLREAGDHSLGAPNGRFTHVAASPASPYVIAASDDRILLWNLDEIEPQELTDRVREAHFLTTDEVLASDRDRPSLHIDLRTGAIKELGTIPEIDSVITSPNGQRSAAITHEHRALLFAPNGSAPPTEIPGDADSAGWVSDTQLVLATDAGTISLYDIQTSTRTPVVDRSANAHLTAIAWSHGTMGGPAWVAAAFSNNTLWRSQITNGVAGAGLSVVLSRSPTSNLRVMPDGNVFVAMGTDIGRWDGGADVMHHAQLPVEITTLADAPSGLFAFANDGQLFAIDPARADSVTDTKEILGATHAAMSPETGLIVVNDRGALDLLDPATQQRWRLAGADTGAFNRVELSRSGRRVIALATVAAEREPPTLVTWPIELPTTAAATAAWLDRMTNAETGSGIKSLGWK